jgi:transposase InsO family protein
VLQIVNLIQINDIKHDQEQNKLLQNNKKNLIEKDGVFYKKIRNKEKIVLSEEFSLQLIKEIHSEWCHIGIKQMMNRICSYYTAKNMISNIFCFCKNCEICIKNKTRGQGKYGLMSQLGPAKKPFEIMSIDTIGGFGGQRSTKKYLHLLVDHFTRYAFISTSKTQSATDFKKLVNKVLETDKIGIILADQYPGINSRDFKEFLIENDIKLIFTAVDSPFSNGLNERLNQTIVNKTRCKINEKEEKRAWTTIARECIEKYNETEHTVTGFTPKYLLDGTDTSILPEDMKIRNNKENWIKDKEIALERTRKSHNYNKKIFDRNRKDYQFKTGDLVYIENGNKLNRKKLDELRIGPYEIIEKISDSIYRVKTGKRKQENGLYHITKLIPIAINNEN